MTAASHCNKWTFSLWRERESNFSPAFFFFLLFSLSLSSTVSQLLLTSHFIIHLLVTRHVTSVLLNLPSLVTLLSRLSLSSLSFLSFFCSPFSLSWCTFSLLFVTFKKTNYGQTHSLVFSSPPSLSLLVPGDWLLYFLFPPAASLYLYVRFLYST